MMVSYRGGHAVFISGVSARGALALQHLPAPGPHPARGAGVPFYTPPPPGDLHPPAEQGQQLPVDVVDLPPQPVQFVHSPSSSRYCPSWRRSVPPTRHRGRSAPVSGRTARAGLPSTMDPGGITLFPRHQGARPTMQSLPITAAVSTTAPMPMSTRSPTVQPWTIAPWPTVTSSPTVQGNPSSVWSTAQSWMLVRAPMVMPSSPAPDHRVIPHRALRSGEGHAAQNPGALQDQYLVGRCGGGGAGCHRVSSQASSFSVGRALLLNSSAGVPLP